MKILVLTPFPAAPGTSGGATAVFSLIRTLASRHEVVCLTYVRPGQEAELAALEAYCSDVVAVPFPGSGASAAVGRYLLRRVMDNIRSLLTLTPALAWKHRSAAMGRAIREALERHRPDVVHICFAPMAQWVAACGDVPAVMDTQDVAVVSGYRRAAASATPWGKAYHFLQWLFWLRYETHWYPRYAKVLTLTPQDGAALKRYRPDLDIYASAIGIDAAAEPPEQPPTARVGFLGSFAHQPNADAVTWLVETIVPRVQARCRNVEFVIAGKNPPACAVDGVTAIGFVDDVSAFYRSVDVVVAPLRHGGGIKIKVLEAMAHGKAVVTTSIGAEGIAEPGEGAFLVADEPAAFAEAVVALLSDGERRTSLGKRARRIIEERFSWQRVCDDLDDIYRTITARRHGEPQR